MFEKASRLKLRFSSSKGSLTVEDLWDLPLTSKTGKANLDDIAIELDTVLSNAPRKSFVDDSAVSAENKLTQLKFDIVQHIIKVRIDENLASNQAIERSAKKQQLLEVLARKQNAQLEAASVEELQAMISAL